MKDAGKKNLYIEKYYYYFYYFKPAATWKGAGSSVKSQQFLRSFDCLGVSTLPFS